VRPSPISIPSKLLILLDAKLLKSPFLDFSNSLSFHLDRWLFSKFVKILTIEVSFFPNKLEFSLDANLHSSQESI
jgi:hypothetical protein